MEYKRIFKSNSKYYVCLDSEQKIENLLKKQREEYEAKLSDQKRALEECKAKLSNQKRECEAKLINQKEYFERQLLIKIDELKKVCHEKDKQEQEIKQLNEEIQKLRNESTTTMKTKKQQPHGIEILDEEQINEFEKIEKIGDGGGGKVYKVFKKVLYALKVMKTHDKTYENMKSFLNEYEIMNFLNHPNILKTFGIFLSGDNKPPSILLEYCQTNLNSLINDKKLSNIELLFYIYQIAEGMKYVHFEKIIHRDLKPTNILVSENGTIKICDFGISKLMTSEEQSMTRGVGSQKFMAPEIINEESNYDEKVDVYSFGVVLYFIISGGEMPVIRMVDILTGKKAEIPSTFTGFAKQLINSCWNFDPKDRPSFKSICEEIARHNFNLIELTKGELKELQVLIEQHKRKIPKYDE